jgi:hypothetical protein
MDPIVQCLTEKKYAGSTSISKATGINRKAVTKQLHKDDRFQRVDPLIVGSGKFFGDAWELK